MLLVSPLYDFSSQKSLQILKQNQYTFMLFLDVVGPGGGLSIFLLLCHSAEMPIAERPGRRQCQQRQIVVSDDGGAHLSTVHASAVLALAAWREFKLRDLFICIWPLLIVFIFGLFCGSFYKIASKRAEYEDN